MSKKIQKFLLSQEEGFGSDPENREERRANKNVSLSPEIKPQEKQKSKRKSPKKMNHLSRKSPSKLDLVTKENKVSWGKREEEERERERERERDGENKGKRRKKERGGEESGERGNFDNFLSKMLSNEIQFTTFEFSPESPEPVATPPRGGFNRLRRTRSINKDKKDKLHREEKEKKKQEDSLFGLEQCAQTQIIDYFTYQSPPSRRASSTASATEGFMSFMPQKDGLILPLGDCEYFGESQKDGSRKTLLEELTRSADMQFQEHIMNEHFSCPEKKDCSARGFVSYLSDEQLAQLNTESSFQKAKSEEESGSDSQASPQSPTGDEKKCSIFPPLPNIAREENKDRVQQIQKEKEEEEEEEEDEELSELYNSSKSSHDKEKEDEGLLTETVTLPSGSMSRSMGELVSQIVKERDTIPSFTPPPLQSNRLKSQSWKTQSDTAKSFDWIFDELVSNTGVTELMEFFFLSYELFTTWDHVVLGLCSRWTDPNSVCIIQCFHYWRTAYEEDWKDKEHTFLELATGQCPLNLQDVELILSERSDLLVELVERDAISRNSKGSKGQFLSLLKGTHDKKFDKFKKMSSKSLSLKDKRTKSKFQLNVEKEKERDSGGKERESGNVREREPSPSFFLDSPPIDKILLSFDASFIAEQITFYQWDLMNHLQSRDLLRWHLSKNHEEDCPVLYKIAQQTNNIAYWVISEIVGQVRLHKRIEIVEKFITISALCLQQRNFLGAKSIYTGINHPAVSRLTKTMKGINRQTVVLLNKLHHFLAMREGNAAFYRSILKQGLAPLVPYLPLHLKDLLYILEGNHNLIDGQVNLKKFYLIWEQISLVLKGCSSPYEDASCSLKMQKLLDNLPVMDQEAIFQWSSRVEPKDPEGLILSFIEMEDQYQKEIGSLHDTIKKLREENASLQEQLHKNRAS